MDGVSNRMFKVWLWNYYVKKSVNNFEDMDISETIYEGEV